VTDTDTRGFYPVTRRMYPVVLSGKSETDATFKARKESVEMHSVIWD